VRISIAIATYNGAKYLGEQLDSFLSQTRPPDELVACDDGSTDSTLEILETFSQQAPFAVRIYRNEKNLGYTKTFERALSKCSGDLIFLSDQDDIWNPNKVSVIEGTFLDHQGAHLLIHDGNIVDENLASHGATKLGQVSAGYGSDAWFVTGALTAIRRDILKYALPIPAGITGHDGWLHYIARMLRQKLVLDQSLQVIRRHRSNTSEWIASSHKPISRLAVTRMHFSDSPAKSYHDRLTYNTVLIDRLRFREQSKNIENSSSQTKVLSNLQAERKAIMNREKLIHFGYGNRKIHAVKMLVCGDYQYFNGVRSFARDFLR
jgi:glycosyltransferase involved in cell wall biosynthesis